MPRSSRYAPGGMVLQASEANDAQHSETRNSPDRCVILVPHGVGSLFQDFERVFATGYDCSAVRRVRGYSQIDVARNEIASRAVLDGFDETMWIDADIGFHPDAVEKLRARNLPIVCGIYPKKGKREFAMSVLPGTKKMVFGKKGGLQEVQYAGTGFLLVRRQVYIDIQFQLGLPLCNEYFGTKAWFRCIIESLFIFGSDGGEPRLRLRSQSVWFHSQADPCDCRRFFVFLPMPRHLATRATS